MGRFAAGLKLGSALLFWLVAWAPLLLYVLAAAVFGALRRPREAVR